MDVFQILLDLKNDGKLRELINAGLISFKVWESMEVALNYDVNRRVGLKRVSAKRKTAEQFDLDVGTVYRTIKRVHYEDWCHCTDKRR